MDQTDSKKNQPLVTVLLPCYNAMPFLKEALYSIRNQSYTNLEILCIDDGSIDNTLSFLQNEANSDSRIKIIENPENIGLIRTLNKGIQLSRGKYIARMDADDISKPDRIKNQLQFITSNDLHLVGGNVDIIAENGKLLNKGILRNFSSHETKLASYLFTPMIHPTIFAKADVLKEENYDFSESSIHTEDYELWTRLIRKGYKLANLKESVLELRKNSNSVSHKFEELQKKNYTKTAINHWKSSFNIPQNLSFESFQIILNRFDSINRKDYGKAVILFEQLSLFNQLKSEWLQSTLLQQRFDILIQAIKKSSGLDKFYFVTQFIGTSFQALFKKSSRHYLSNKFRR